MTKNNVGTASFIRDGRLFAKRRYHDLWGLKDHIEYWEALFGPGPYELLITPDIPQSHSIHYYAQKINERAEHQRKTDPNYCTTAEKADQY